MNRAHAVRRVIASGSMLEMHMLAEILRSIVDEGKVRRVMTRDSCTDGCWLLGCGGQAVW